PGWKKLGKDAYFLLLGRAGAQGETDREKKVRLGCYEQIDSLIGQGVVKASPQNRLREVLDPAVRVADGLGLKEKAARLYVARGLLVVAHPGLVIEPYDRAVKDFTEAIRLDPQPPYRIYRAFARYEGMGSHQNDRALKDIEREADQALAEDPKFAEAYLYK